MEQLESHEILALTVPDDPLLLADIEAWCRRQGHRVEFTRSPDGTRLRIVPNKSQAGSRA